MKGNHNTQDCGILGQNQVGIAKDKSAFLAQTSWGADDCLTGDFA